MLACIESDTPVHFCANTHEIVAKLNAGSAAAVVLELGSGAGRDLPAISAVLGGRLIPLMLRCPMHASSIRDVVACYQRVNVVCVSLLGVDSLAADVAALLASATREQPRLVILSRVLPSLPGSAVPIVTAALAAGNRALSVAQLAALCGFSTRTLEMRCRAAAILSPKPLLEWSLTLHAAWCVARCEGSPQEIAEAAGLPSLDSLASRVKRATGMRLVRLCRTFNFEELLDCFAEALVVKQATSTGSGKSTRWNPLRVSPNSFAFRQMNSGSEES